MSIFADDSKIYFKADCTTDIDAIQSDINKVFAWCQEWQLTVATSKCSMLHIGRNNNKHVYSMGGCEIPAVEFLRDLGVTVPSNLSFSPHVANIVGIVLFNG